MFNNVELRRRLALVVAPSIATLAVIVIGLCVDSYWQYVLAVSLSAAFVGASVVLLVGLARCVSLATGSMMALGAYGSALAVTHFNFPFLLAVLFGAAIGGFGGLILAVPGVRFRSHNLAMVTLVFQEVLMILIREAKLVTGGPEGLAVPPASIAGVAITSDLSFLVVMSVGIALGLIPLAILINGAFGKNLRAIAASEVASRAYGINIERYLIAAFVVSSSAVAYSAALIAPRYRIIDPDSYGILSSIFALSYPIIGGTNSIWGGIAGGAFLRTLPEVLRPVADYIEFATACLVVVVILFLPGGLVEAIRSRFSSSAKPQNHAFAKSESIPPSPVVRVITPAKENDVHLCEVRNLSMHYGALKAVDNVSIDITSGNIHGLMGPNGAGKTTLFNAISGFIKPTFGDVYTSGISLLSQSIDARIGLGITRTFQHVAIFPNLTCLDNVKIGLGYNSVLRSMSRSVTECIMSRSSDDEDKRALLALSAVGLDHCAELRAGLLSLGNQRRLELARAIVSRPKLLLLDEPVSGVSSEEVERIGSLLRQINREFGITMLIVEHNIGFLVSICDKLSVMHSGTVVAEGIPDDVVNLPVVRNVYFGERALAS
ncbi:MULTISPECIES: branched-chain amino acid ABC transporter ATP-binding protein/permease [unclassified Beijerinckia]|uniref:branched-chain amino acid ABC transporter ATP-binding protein/permease n=1 Tax=unclassified Beijerinckia TaxID=2638183 RepID=UPI000895F7A1|nr:MULTISPECIES: branched-chain amino acid ABC transporter ATP-binding protein/permease [unclassified Beijerinckia]MDH7799270.1 branched-chain amino acid transport system permease protein [Beijerinckia sp. GAS462]SED90097.1 branched-chain amino acid transport system permease protein [Beijerinckia sp. 28-YEA-48]